MLNPKSERNEALRMPEGVAAKEVAVGKIMDRRDQKNQQAGAAEDLKKTCAGQGCLF